MWSAKDNEALQKLLLPFNSPELRPEIQGIFGSEARGLISSPKSEVYDRATSFYGRTQTKPTIVALTFFLSFFLSFFLIFLIKES